MNRRTFRSIASVMIAGSIAVAASSAGAQRRTSLGPDYWVGVSMGYVDGIQLTDNASGSGWNIGSSSQIRATVEKALQGGATLGLSAGFGSASMTYTAGTSTAAACGFQCQAKVDINQYLLFMHGGAGVFGGGGRGSTQVGLHGIYTLEGGITQFTNLREETTGEKLPPTSASSDFTFGFGGGIGYGLSPAAELYAGALSEFILHKQSTTSTSSAPRVFQFRGGIRIGF